MTSKYLLLVLFHFSVSYGSTRTFWSRRSHTCEFLCICICLFRFADHYGKLSSQATGFLLMVMMLPMLAKPLLWGIGNTTVACQKKINISNNGNRWLHLLYQTENTTYGLDLSQDWTNSSLNVIQTERPSDSTALNRESLWYDSKNNTISCFGGARSFATPALASLPPQPDSIWRFGLNGEGGGAWHEVLGPVSSSKWHSPFSRWSVRKRWQKRVLPWRPPKEGEPRELTFSRPTKIFPQNWFNLLTLIHPSWPGRWIKEEAAACIKQTKSSPIPRLSTFTYGWNYGRRRTGTTSLVVDGIPYGVVLNTAVAPKPQCFTS